MESVFKSQNDKREYYTYTLPNGLRVILIYDKDVDLSSVALTVKVGYFYDNIPGIAHFLEHMVFTGTSKFPGENDFPSLIAKYNGTHNAYTCYDHTCYYFSVVEKGFEPALENFGDMFVSPILNKNTIEREKEAVNSEHIKNINDDDWRSHELIKVASIKNHPIRQFGSGSNKTLNVENIDVHVKNFFDNYYSADKMTLIIVTSANPNKTKEKVNEIFSQITIKKENNVLLNILKNNKILNPPKVIKYIPLENENRMILTWEIPYYRDPKESPFEFLHYLISNEMKNSISCILSNEGYVVDFSCHVREIIYTRCLFNIEFKLSPLGQKHKKRVLGTVIEYIKLLQNNIDNKMLEQIYNEQKQLALYRFKYPEKQSSLDTVTNMSTLINDYDFDPKYINVINLLQNDYQNIKENLKNILDHMTLDKMVVITGSKEYKNATNEFPNYGTKYTVENKQIGYDKIVGQVGLLHPNPYISTLENIIQITEKQPIEKYTNSGLKAYWHPNTSFNTPDICLIAKIDFQISTRHVYLHTCIMLYLNSILTENNCDVYLYNSASYSFNIGYEMGNIYFKLNGNYGKFYEVCNNLINMLINSASISDKSFETSKYALIHQDDNSLYNPAYEQTTELFNKMISKYYYSAQDRKKIINDITKDQMIDVFNKLFTHKKILLYVLGNCDEILFDKINSIFERLTHGSKVYVNKSLYEFPQKNINQKITNINKHEENVAVAIYVYLGTFDFNNTAKITCLTSMLDNLISTEYFDQLRTKEMFGYIVSGKLVKIEEYGIDVVAKESFFYCFLVQSPHKTVEEITERTIQFIDSYSVKLKNMSDVDSNIAFSSYMTLLDKKFNNLCDMASYTFSTTIENELKLDYKDVLKESCRTLTKKDFYDFYFDKFVNNRIQIVIQLSKENKNNIEDMKGGGYSFCGKNCMCLART